MSSNLGAPPGEGQLATFEPAACGVGLWHRPPQSLLLPCHSQSAVFCSGIKSMCTQFAFHLQTKASTLNCHVCAISAPQIQCFTEAGEERKHHSSPTASSLLERRTCILFVLSCLFAFSYLVANGNSASNLILTGELLSRTHILSTATRMLGCRLSCLFVPCCLHWDLFKGCSHVSFCLVPSEPGAECGAVGAEHERPH